MGVLAATSLSLLTVGCNGSGVPYMSALDPGVDAKAPRPPVSALVEHIQCEIAADMYQVLDFPDHRGLTDTPLASDEDGLWARLLEENFVANVTLSLQVTNNEGLNPSVSIINPFNPIPIPNLPGATMPMSFSGNFTLGIAGQFDGSQSRSFNVVYLLDLVQLYYNYNKISKADWSEKNRADRNFPCPNSELLGGDLGLRDVIFSGLQALDVGSDYDVYSVPDDSEAGRTTRHINQDRRNVDYHLDRLSQGSETKQQVKDNTPGNLFTTELVNSAPFKQFNESSDVTSKRAAVANMKKALDASQSQRLRGVAAVPRARPALVGPEPAVGEHDKNPGSAANPPIYFSSNVQFVVTEGLSGGPSWSLRNFTGPNSGGGGVGGGGGGGSASGGSGKGGSAGGSSGGGGGGGGSASQGFLNFNRNESNQMLIQVAATCRVKPSQQPSYWERVPKCQDAPTKARIVSNVLTPLFDLVTSKFLY